MASLARAASIPVAAVVLAALAICGCYIVARAHGHVPGGLQDLPDITHCAMQQPERWVASTPTHPHTTLPSLACAWHLR